MSIHQHASEWLGYPVEYYDPEGDTPDYRNTLYRIATEYDSGVKLTDLFARFLDHPDSREAPAIIFGYNGDFEENSAPQVEALVAMRGRLPKVRGVFLSDMTGEDCEISWIHQCNVSPILRAYPELKHFRIRGTDELVLGRIEHAKLKSLVIESGGLNAEILHNILVSDLPALEHLELWLGDREYGGSVTLEDLEPLFSGKLFPKLKCLGLRDSEFQDEIAAAIARAPVLGQLETLDFSLGTLSDEGAAALLTSDALRRLKKIDLHHHYLSNGMMARLKESGLNLDLSEQQAPHVRSGEEHRYVAVSE